MSLLKSGDHVVAGHNLYGGSFRLFERVLKLAVKGMLPKGRLGYAMIKKLKIYAGPAHPHASQQPNRPRITASV